MPGFINWDRDNTWILPELTAQAYSASHPVDSNNIKCSTDGVVYTNHGNVRNNLTPLTATAGEQMCIGLYMRPPLESAKVYRVKGSATGFNGQFQFGYGYGAASVSPGDSDVFGPIYFGSSNGIVDDVVTIKPVATGNPRYGNPLCFFVAAINPQDVLPFTFLSVQDLAVQPDQYEAAVF